MKTEEMFVKSDSVIPGRFRPVWNFERKFIKSPAANVSVVARVRGAIAPEQMKKALYKLQEIHPLLRSRIVEDPDHNAYLHTDDVPDISLQVIKRISDKHWYDALVEEHKIPFNSTIGPLVRFKLLLSDDPKQPSELIIFCQHTICDGTALANCIRDLLKHYADPTLPSTSVVPPRTLEDILPQGRGFSSLLKRAAMGVMNQKWRENPFIFSHRDFLDIHRAYWQEKVYRFVLLELSRQETSALNQKCRENGVTINSALIVAFVKAYQDILGPLPKENLVIPYDLRRRSDFYKDTFCLLISSAEISLAKVMLPDFWDATKALHKEIVKKINNKSVFSIINDLQSLDGSILDTMGLATSATYMPPGSPNYNAVQAFLKDKKNLANVFAAKFKNALPGVVLTNLGRLDFPEFFGEVQLEKMFFTPSASETIPLQLAAVGVSGSLTLTINYIDDLNSPDSNRTDRYIQIRNRALDYLDFANSPAQSNEAF